MFLTIVPGIVAATGCKAALAEMLPLPKLLLQPLALDWLARANVRVAVLRLDLTDPELSGNKWCKLSGHLRRAIGTGCQQLISVGGPHSNHLHALAAAGKRFGLQTIGLLRGHAQETPTVRDLLKNGMQLHWLGYAGYRDRYQPGFWPGWLQRYPGSYPVPEGGGGLTGAMGCAPLVKHLASLLSGVGWHDYDGWWLAAGTGSTLAGLVIGERGCHPVCGALAGPASHRIDQQVDRLLAEAGQPANPGSYQLYDACRAGFGRFDDPLLQFMTQTEQASGIPLEPVYTAKALLALRHQVEHGRFAPGSRLVFVHTGGLQGRRTLQCVAGGIAGSSSLHP